LTDHRCRAKQHCAALTSDGSAITAKPSTLCHNCQVRLQRQLDQLPAIVDALRCFLATSLVPIVQSKVQATHEPREPINIRALDLIDEIGDVIDRAGGLRVADLIQQPAEEYVIWSGSRVQRKLLDGVDRALDIGRAWRKADGIIGLSEKVWERRIGECPKCNLQTLGNWSGSDTVTCSSCGGSMTRSEYSRICLIRAEKQ